MRRKWGEQMSCKSEVVVVGMGYVGLTLAVTLANAGLKVWGYERRSDVVDELNQGIPTIFKPCLEDLLNIGLNSNLIIRDYLPAESPEYVIICVSTPAGSDNKPNLDSLRAASQAIAECIDDETLVIVRSTVPVGVTRGVVLPELLEKHNKICLACCPERTIQGQALSELNQLPQIVGALDDDSHDRAIKLWQHIGNQVVSVTSLEAAEMVKLINNCHTDVLYSFGNEVAMMAKELDLDPYELISAANLNYPRPNLARPGFVAGPCLTKDTYLLTSSFNNSGYSPTLIPAARSLNESLSRTVAEHFISSLKETVGDLEGTNILVCGFAYKGSPITDDMRGTPTIPLIDELLQYPINIYGHDFIVSEDSISATKAVAVADLKEGIANSRGIIFVNEHPEYRNLDIVELSKLMQTPSLIYDCWRIFDVSQISTISDVRYASIGYG